MRNALDGAVDPHDVAFCRVQPGDLAFGRGDLDTAATEYAAALAADPASIGGRQGTARVSTAHGDLSQAISAYGRITARLPGTSTLVEYASVLRLAGRDAEADAQIDLAAAAERLFTSNGGVDGLAAASVALAQDRPADAVTAARAEWSRRQHPDVADTLAWSLHAAGQDAEALRYAKRAVAGGAHPAVYTYHLGMIQLGLGDKAAARTEFSRALATNPYFSPADAMTARRALAGLS